MAMVGERMNTGKKDKSKKDKSKKGCKPDEMACGGKVEKASKKIKKPSK